MILVSLLACSTNKILIADTSHLWCAWSVSTSLTIRADMAMTAWDLDRTTLENSMYICGGTYTSWGGCGSVDCSVIRTFVLSFLTVGIFPVGAAGRRLCRISAFGYVHWRFDGPDHCVFIPCVRYKCGIPDWQSDAAGYSQELWVRARSFITLPLLCFCPENPHWSWLLDEPWLCSYEYLSRWSSTHDVRFYWLSFDFLPGSAMIWARCIPFAGPWQPKDVSCRCLCCKAM